MAMDEKRKNPRFKLSNNLYAALQEDVYKVGKIQDINANGLSFTYAGSKAQVGDDLKVDLFQIETDYHISDLPCKVVYVLPAQKRRKNIATAQYYCGLNFNPLKKRQKEDLDQIIKISTTAR